MLKENKLNNGMFTVYDGVKHECLLVALDKPADCHRQPLKKDNDVQIFPLR